MDAHRPAVLAAGFNDFVDWQPCPEDAATGSGTCRGSNRGVGLSGVSFSFDSGRTWTQPTYTGITSRDCPSTAVADCTPHTGPIGTLPWYAENGLISSGDPAVAFGPRRVNGAFSWENGSRLYYVNLAGALNATFPQQEPIRGYLAIGVSRMDNPTPENFADKNAWLAPVIVTERTSATTFEDKEQVWADNAASSPYFGSVYVCVDEYRSNGQGAGFSQTEQVARSRDGGDTWTMKQVRSATANAAKGFRGACNIRTDSDGVVYLFYTHFQVGTPGLGAHTLQKSFDGGKTWTKPRDVIPANDACFNIDQVSGRCVADGGAGARIDLLSMPSVDIANGAPTGADATNEIVDAWGDGSLGLNHEVTRLSHSEDGGLTWSAPETVSLAGDRPIYSAPAIAPDGSAIYLMYEALTDPWRGADMTSSRGYHGIFRRATLDASGSPGAWSTLLTGPLGDIRATYPGHDIYQERVGDYVYAAASRTYGVGVWADASDASVCPDVQDYRAASYAAGQRVLPGAPWPTSDCAATFGNVQIRAATSAE
ncbi:MAG: exo-alpha-sialidase [Chloroflexi bacterium]|nr:exo-alpha-sialidase [Chloroflexota bacterium]